MVPEVEWGKPVCGSNPSTIASFASGPYALPKQYRENLSKYRQNMPAGLINNIGILKKPQLTT